MKTNRKLLSTSLAILTTLGIVSCYSTNPATTTTADTTASMENLIKNPPGKIDPKPGDLVIYNITYGNQNPAKITYKLHELEKGQNTLVMLPETLEAKGDINFYDPHKLNDIKIADIEQFLTNHWDEYINGKNDEGVNSKEFVDLINKYGIDIQVLYRAFDSSYNQGMTLPDFFAFLEKMSKLKSENGQGVYHFLNFLFDMNLTVKDFKDSLTKANVTEEQFIDYLDRGKLNFINLLNNIHESTKNIVDFLPSIINSQALKTKDIGGDIIDAGKLGLDIAKFAWDVVKDNAPVAEGTGAFTSVLNINDTNALSYEKAKENSSKEIQIDANYKPFIFFGPELWPVVMFHFQANSAYGATHPKYGGKYLPNVNISINKILALWPFQISAGAQVKNAYNLNTAENPNPKIELELTMHIQGGVIASGQRTFQIIFTGEQGFTEIKG